GRYLRLRELFTPVRDSWHQFRVLTARYVELVLGDRRGLRLLLLQAPIVAVFLLVGFVNKDFRRPMPIPRELTAEERKMLTALQAVDKLLDEDVHLDPKQKKALRAVKFQYKADGLPMTLSGTQVLGLLRRLRNKKLDPEQEKLLEGVQFTLDHEGE